MENLEHNYQQVISPFDEIEPVLAKNQSLQVSILYCLKKGTTLIKIGCALSVKVL